MGNKISTGNNQQQQSDEDNPIHWNKQRVQKWLDMNGFNEYSQLASKYNIDGRTLFNMDDNRLQYYGISNAEDRGQMIEAITALGQLVPQRDMEEEERERTLNTLKKLATLIGMKKLESEAHVEKARNLSIPISMLETYLNTDVLSARQVMFDLLEPASNSNNTLNPFTMTLTSTFDSTDPFALMNEEKEVESLRRTLDLFTNDKQSTPKTNYLKIKLVVVEINETTSGKAIRQVLSPLMEGFGMAQKFGLFHTGMYILIVRSNIY
jgi:hypothetical protein